MFRLERFDERSRMPPWVWYQHAARYEYVAGAAQGRDVLDVGCGDGGCARRMALAGASRVDACDVSLSAIQEARARTAPPRIEFYVADARRLPFASESYDLVVSLEMIEHIHDDRLCLSEAARVLRHDGCFLCSTPNRVLLNPRSTIAHPPSNPFHVREYSLVEFVSLLGECFASVTLIGQSFYSMRYVRALQNIGRVSRFAAARAHQARKCLTWPFERIEWHRPSPIPPDCQPEIMLALCRLR